jgi:hypothetical protein
LTKSGYRVGFATRLQDGVAAQLQARDGRVAKGDLGSFHLRDTLNGIVVREGSFNEFLAALKLSGRMSADKAISRRPENGGGAHGQDRTADLSLTKGVLYH